MSMYVVIGGKVMAGLLKKGNGNTLAIIEVNHSEFVR